MNEALIGVFREVQLRHAKRMVKIMEHLVKFPEDHLLLDVLVAEEHEKRAEDYLYIMSATKAQGQLLKTIDNLAREISDDSVIYLLKHQITNLKAVRGL